MRSTAATVAYPALDDHELVDAGVEFVARLSAVRYSPQDLRIDAGDPQLEQKVRGSLVLLREDLADSARWALIDAIDQLGASSQSDEAQYAADWCTDVLGANETVANTKTVKRRWFARH